MQSHGVASHRDRIFLIFFRSLRRPNDRARQWYACCKSLVFATASKTIANSREPLSLGGGAPKQVFLDDRHELVELQQIDTASHSALRPIDELDEGHWRGRGGAGTGPPEFGFCFWRDNYANQKI